MLLGRSRATRRRHGRSNAALSSCSFKNAPEGSAGIWVARDRMARICSPPARTLRNLKPQFPKLYNFLRARGVPLARRVNLQRLTGSLV